MITLLRSTYAINRECESSSPGFFDRRSLMLGSGLDINVLIQSHASSIALCLAVNDYLSSGEPDHYKNMMVNKLVLNYGGCVMSDYTTKLGFITDCWKVDIHALPKPMQMEP